MAGVSAERFDWLHLLAVPPEGWGRLVLLGAAALEHELVVAAGVADEVRTDLKALAEADAVAVLGGDADVAEVLRCATAAREVLVRVERTPRFPRALRRTEQVLGSAGFTVRSRHWPVPDATHPRRYLPLDHPGALRWYVRNLLIASGPAGVAAAALPLLARWWPGLLRTIVPTVVVVAARHGVGAAGEAALVLTSGNDRGSRTVRCWFGPGDRRPRRVDKVPTDPSGNDTIAREQEALRAVAEALPAHLSGSVPAAGGTRSLGRLLAGTESVLDGSPIAVSSAGADLDGPEDDLAAAAGWLSELAAATASTRVWTEGCFSEWIEDPARRGPTAAAGTLVAVLRPASEALTGMPIPTCWAHGDFGPWNVVRGPDGIGVADWEAATLSGPGLPALCDLVYFATYWVHVAAGMHDEPGHREAARQLWIEAEPTLAAARRARRVVAETAQRLGVPDHLVSLVVGHTWLRQAAQVADRRQRLGIDPSRPDHAATVLGVLADRPDDFVAATRRLGRPPPG